MPSKLHCTDGVGLPPTYAEKVAAYPTSPVTAAGCCTITGACPTLTYTVALCTAPNALPTTTAYRPESAIPIPPFW